MLNFVHAERYPVDLERRCHGVGCLLKNEVVQLSDVVFNPRLDVETNPAYLVNQVLPVRLHGPPPAVAVRSGIIDIPDVVHQHAPEQLPDRLLGEAERLRSLVPELQLHPDPVLVLRQAAFCRLVVNTD